MIIIKTDKELKRDKRNLEIRLAELKRQYRELLNKEAELYDIWRQVKDPIVKREIHREIFKWKDGIAYRKLERNIQCVESDIREINRFLYSYPSMTIGCIYDTYQELDYNSIALYGIRGVRL